MRRARHWQFSERFTSGWIARLTLAGILAVLGVGSLADTLANVIVKFDPNRAHSLSPGDGKIAAKLAALKFKISPASAEQSEPAQLSRKALLQDATSVEALTVLGLQAQLRNDTEQARRYFVLSLAMSRRELAPRIWAIEEAIGRGDIHQALANYDIALKTSASASELLFPILTTAIAEPKIRKVLLGRLESKPAWGVNFIRFVAPSMINPTATVLFFDEGKARGLPILDADRAKLVNALLGNGRFNEAWQYYTSFRVDADRTHSRDAKFAIPTTESTLYDWTVPDGAEAASSIVWDEKGGVVDFFAPPSVGGVLLQQIQVLPPGRYRLLGHSIGIEQSSNAAPYWSLKCREGQELGRVAVPNSSQSRGNFTGLFTVPQGCKVQTLSLVARPTGDLVGLAGQIDFAQISPIS